MVRRSITSSKGRIEILQHFWIGLLKRLRYMSAFSDFIEEIRIDVIVVKIGRKEVFEGVQVKTILFCRDVEG
jgi:hypothetical protein